MPRRLFALLLLIVCLGATRPWAQSLLPLAERQGPLPSLFPADNWWNQEISTAPVDARSAQFMAFINNGGTRRLHPDFGGYESPGGVGIYGVPYVVVGGDQPKRAVQFYYGDESDGVDHATGRSVPFYPIPDEAITQPYWIEGGAPGNTAPGGDRHMLIVDRDNRILYELFDLKWNGSQWTAGSGAAFNLATNSRRPEGWTSADASGLAMLPGLVRYDEAAGSGEIQHAFRVTLRATNGYVWPASHRAGSNPQALPMGARLRLKAGTDLSGFHPGLQRIFRAMQRYGLIVADNGSDMFITGAFDPRWPSDVLNPAFHALTASDFEVIELGWRGQPTSTACAPTGTPSPFSVSTSGRFAVLAWAGVAGATDYVVEVGSATGQSDMLVAPVGAVTSVSTVASPNLYYTRVRARNACGATPPSNEVVVRIS
jgi:hypothetical protein